MPSWVYLHVNPRIRALLSYILPKKPVERLLDATSASELQNIFMNTHYGEHFKEGEEFTPEAIELSLRRHFFEVYTSLSRGMTGEVNTFFKAFMNLFDAVNLKHIIRGIHSKRIEETVPYLVPIGKQSMAYYLNLLESENMMQAISQISDDPIRTALERVYPRYEATQLTFILESALDRQIYTHLWKIASSWKRTAIFGARERFSLRNLIGEKIDLANILITLRALSLGLNPEQFIIPVAYKIVNELDAATKFPNMRDALEAFSKSFYFGPLIHRLPEGVPDIVSRLEVIFNRYHVKKCRVKLADFPFQITPFYCFFTIKFFEVQDLKTLMIGKLEGVEAADIKDLLIVY
jgi:V/A-type H+-transporting ATPase subunit C